MKDIKLLEVTEVNSLECQTQEGRLRSLGLFSWEKTRLRGDFVTVHNFLRGISRGGGADLLSLLLNYRTQGNGMKLSGEIQIRKRFFFERVVRPWNRFPVTVVRAAPPSEVKQHLGDAFSHMPWLYVVLQGAGSCSW